MKISEIAQLLNAEIIVPPPDDSREIISACGADLMSDVMAFSKENAMLLTGLINPQVVRTAEMMDICVIVFVRGKKPQTCMMELAQQKGIALLSTESPMFVSCGKLFEKGILGKGT